MLEFISIPAYILINILSKSQSPLETFAKRPILIQFKAGDNFNHWNTLSISRIKI